VLEHYCDWTPMMVNRIETMALASPGVSAPVRERLAKWTT
jgi:hypothetical protein